MSQLVYSPLESCELAHYAVDVPCFVCNGGNRHDVERCRHCFAPLALTYQAADQRTATPKMLAVLGPRGAGKTSYLGLLCDSLSRQRGATQVVSRGAFSVSLQQQVIEQLASQRFPASTAEEAETWNWNHLQIAEAKRRRPRELIFPDMSGASIEREISEGNSPTIRAFLQRCSGAIILLDTQRIERGDPGPCFFAKKMLSYLGELASKRRASWQRKPIAFLFTKSDCSQACLDTPRRFAEDHLGAVLSQATLSLNRFEFFAASVAGATIDLDVDGERLPVALRVEPHGIREPLDWMLNQLGR